MKRITLLFIITLFLGYTAIQSQNVHHNLHVSLDIENSSLKVTDSISIKPVNTDDDTLRVFYLNESFVLDKEYSVQNIKELSIDSILKIQYYQLPTIDKKQKPDFVVIKYTGKLPEEIEKSDVDYARGFSTTDGIICESGVFLAGSTYWIPTFNEPYISYTLTVEIQKEWSIVSQGTRVFNIVREDERTMKYVSPDPMEEVYLIAAKFTEYQKDVNGISVQAFLRTPDEALANKYIGVTAKYLVMYEELIGKYPYNKFALIENFWETGYGMPSFTLLGEKIIRFPWILFTSYPHELLHNWWGNSVYVDYSTGNWCEGITSYMADHLMKEQEGKGSDYRRTTLQKFTDYVNDENDFPLSGFRSRNNSAQEAIGYGKAMMMNDMLRLMYGDEVFTKSWAKFYKDNKFKAASFSDLKKSFEEITNENLDWFFNQWVNRKGAPGFELSDVSVNNINEEYIIKFKLKQTQTEDVFDVFIPVGIYYEGNNGAKIEKIHMTSREQEFEFKGARPVRIDIDPQFNIFRRLAREEVPPSLSQIFGSSEGLIILPKNSPLIHEYAELAEFWEKSQKTQNRSFNVVFDHDVKVFPNDKTVWVIGFENKFYNKVNLSEVYENYIDTNMTSQINELKKSGSLVYSMINIDNPKLSAGFLGTNTPEAIPGLIRKLTHYGKYGILGFTGPAPDNILKGSLPTLSSPLTYLFKYKDEVLSTSSKLPIRKALY